MRFRRGRKYSQALLLSAAMVLTMPGMSAMAINSSNAEIASEDSYSEDEKDDASENTGNSENPENSEEGAENQENPGDGEETENPEKPGDGEETEDSEEPRDGEETEDSEEPGDGEETGDPEEPGDGEETGDPEKTEDSEKTENPEEALEPENAANKGQTGAAAAQVTGEPKKEAEGEEKLITAWEWIDEDEVLDKGTLMIAKGTTIFEDEIIEVLPTAILAEVIVTDEDGEESTEEEEIELEDWSCEDYPEDGASTGTYRFTATLPEEYTLGEEADSLKVTVKFAEAAVLAEVEGAAAIGDKGYDTLAKAFEEAVEGDEIRLLADVKADLRLGLSDSVTSEMIEIAEGLTLNLNGYTLSGESEYPLGLYNVEYFTITDDADSAGNMDSAGNVDSTEDTDSETVSSGGSGTIRANNGTYAVYAEGTILAIEGGNFTGSKRAVELTSSECTISNGTFEGSSYSVYVGRGSKLVITGGEFHASGSGKDYAALFITKYDTEVSLEGGTFEGAAAIRTAGETDVLSVLGDGFGYEDKSNELITDGNILYGNVIDENVRVVEADFEVSNPDDKDPDDKDPDDKDPDDKEPDQKPSSGSSTSGSSGSSHGGSGGGSSRRTSSSSGMGVTGTVTVDPKKGYVNSALGVISGDSSKGYSSWKIDDKGWKFVYADGTQIAGSLMTAEDGTVKEVIAWEKINGAWYAFNADGYTVSDWVLDGGRWYYLDVNSGMKTGWQNIGGKWYYLSPVTVAEGQNIVHPQGALYQNGYTPDGYYVDAFGVWDEKGAVSK